MQNLLTQADFIGEYFIASDMISDDELNTYISTTQNKVLRKLLGYDLYKLFEAGLQEEPIPEKWLNLLNGFESFEGIKTMLIPFVYSNYVRGTAQRVYTAGVSAIENENSKRVDGSVNAIVAYNRAVDLYIESASFISNANAATANTYPNWVLTLLDKETIFC